MISPRKILSLSLLLGFSFAASPAVAGSLKLPVKLDWCESRASVEDKLKSPREANDDVVESGERIYSVDGFVSAIFEQDQLVKVSVRFYETESNAKKVMAALKKMLGQGSVAGSATKWSTGEGDVQFKVQTEQIYASFTAPSGRCVMTKSAQSGGMSDQEKADQEALKKKQAVQWDPYAMDDEDDEDKPIVKRKKSEEEKKAEEAKKKEEEEDDLEDEDIDW